MEFRRCTLGYFIRLYEALSARMGYLLIRNSLYKIIYDRFKPIKLTNDLTHREKGVIAAFSGAVATGITHPLETVMVRKMGELGRDAKFCRKNINHDVYNGLKVNMLRSFILNGIIIWPYDVMNEKLYHTFGDIWPNRFISLFCASLVGVLSTFVLDNIKTRLLFEYGDKSLNRLNYSGSGSNAFFKALTYEGSYTFFAGFYPMFLKMYIYSASVT